MKKEEIRELLAENPNQHYVYVLKDSVGSPFYVGLGQGLRLFQHEDEAHDVANRSAKCERIRGIIHRGEEIDYEIDSFHDVTPWHREEELIQSISKVYQLTNAQSYAPATEIDGVVLRKYAHLYGDGADVSAIPPDFPYTNTRLAIGPNRPGPRAKVYGRIHAILAKNPGITGAALITQLHEVDWSDVKSAYAEGRSRVSGKWLADYVVGGFYMKNQFIRIYDGNELSGSKGRSMKIQAWRPPLGRVDVNRPNELSQCPPEENP